MAENTRYNYIEPNNIVVGNKTNRDNEVWVMEDYNMSVDLQVIMPKRTETFSLSRDNLMVSIGNANSSPLGRYLSFMGGARDNGGEKGSLTDSYINASYSELTSKGVSDPECLGISNVHINFNEQFYPQVSITFIDVRGYSLMMPSELVYAKNLKGEKVDPELNFFSSLFQFPYPMFLLTVKGNYGDRVTFQLAVNEFHNSFNNDTGNFEVTVDFIGFLYGLYTDIPANFIIAAPYFGKTDTSTYCEYWQQKIDNGDFNFSDGGKILTFVEYVEALHNVNKRIVSEAMSEVRRGQAKLEERVNMLKSIQTLFDIACKALYKTDLTFGSNYEYCLISQQHYYLYLTKVPRNGNQPFVVQTENIDAFNGKVDYYNSQYNTKISNIPNPPGNFTKVSSYTELMKDVGGIGDMDKVISDYKTDLEKARLTGYFLYDSEKIKNEIGEQYQDAVKTLNEYNKEHEEALLQEVKEQINKGLGFPPTVENIYRMIFAHIDCFIHLFYELIDDIKKNEKERPVDKIKDNDVSCDVSGWGSIIKYMPPFPNVFRDNKAENKPNELLWIGAEPEFANFSEVRFVEDLFKAVISTKSKANGIFKQDLPVSKDGDSTSPAFDFYPALVTDIFYMSNNPFDYFETSAERFGNDYFGALLYFVALRMKAYYFTSLGIDEEDTLKKLKLRAKIDAYNYVKRNQTCPDVLKKGLDGLSGERDAAAKAIYDEFVSNHDKILEDRILCHVKSIIKSENGDEYKNFGIGKEGRYAEDRFYAWMGDTVLTPQAFSEAWNRPLPSEDETKIFDQTDRKVYGNQNRNLTCYIDEQPTTNTYAYDFKTEIEHESCRMFEADEEEEPKKVDYAQMCANEAVAPSGSRYVKNAFFYKKKGGYGQLINLFLGEAYPKNIEPTKDDSKVPTNGGKLKMLTFASMGSGKDMRFGERLKGFANCNSRYVKTSLHQIGFEAASAFYLKSNVGNFTTIYELVKGSKAMAVEYTPINLDLDLKDIRGGRAPINDLYNIFVDKDTPLQEIFQDVNRNKGNVLFTGTTSLPETLSAVFKRYLTQPAVYLYVANNTQEKSENVGGGYTLGRTLTMEEFNSLLPEVLRSFVVGLEAGYGSEQRGKSTTTKREINVEGSGMVTDSHKLAAYESLKQLYDKWLTVYGRENFELKEYGAAKNRRYSRHVKSSEKTHDDSEFDNFIYMDSFYRDISNDFYINPRSLYDTIKNHLDANSNYSVYEFKRLCTKGNS